jgi:hypothetical protein
MGADPPRRVAAHPGLVETVARLRNVELQTCTKPTPEVEQLSALVVLGAPPDPRDPTASSIAPMFLTDDGCVDRVLGAAPRPVDVIHPRARALRSPTRSDRAGQRPARRHLPRGLCCGDATRSVTHPRRTCRRVRPPGTPPGRTRRRRTCQRGPPLGRRRSGSPPVLNWWDTRASAVCCAGRLSRRAVLPHPWRGRHGCASRSRSSLVCGSTRAVGRERDCPARIAPGGGWRWGARPVR